VVQALKFEDNRHNEVARLSALLTGRLYSTGNIPRIHFCYRRSRPQGHSGAGKITSMKNSSDTIGNQTRDLPACSAVPQPNASPRAPYLDKNLQQIKTKKIKYCENIMNNLQEMCARI
jgi:hypothetical protein